MAKHEHRYPNLAQLHRVLMSACRDPAMKGAKEMAIELPWADWIAVKAELRNALHDLAKEQKP